jgi:hypothetical protein
MASCLMVLTDPARIPNVHHALNQFDQQRWPYRELVLINSTDSEFTSAVPNVRVFNVKAKFLGELKNLSVYNAKGEWCLPWPDDVKVSPDYIDFHMVRRSKASPTVIQNPVGYVLKDGLNINLEPEYAPFVSFFRFSPYIYDQDGSDWRFISKYPELNLVQAPAGTALRFFEDYEH